MENGSFIDGLRKGCTPDRTYPGGRVCGPSCNSGIPLRAGCVENRTGQVVKRNCWHNIYIYAYKKKSKMLYIYMYVCFACIRTGSDAENHGKTKIGNGGEWILDVGLHYIIRKFWILIFLQHCTSCDPNAVWEFARLMNFLASAEGSINVPLGVCNHWENRCKTNCEYFFLWL